MHTSNSATHGKSSAFVASQKGCARRPGTMFGHPFCKGFTCAREPFRLVCEDEDEDENDEGES